jgi:hypothetical protein
MAGLKPKLILALFAVIYALSATSNADTALIRSHLRAITKSGSYRTFNDTVTLNRTAKYIRNAFMECSDSVRFQEYVVNGRTYRNVICSFGTAHKKRIIVGAHYDVCTPQEGADDNASGTVALLELARMLKETKPGYRIDMVAYSTEEPPYFGTEDMGSAVHAKYLRDNKVDVYGMVAIEMIGYFSDERKSQTYPLGIFSLVYGRTGNFITLVNKPFKGGFARNFTKKFRAANTIRTRRFMGPRFIPGIDWSDHKYYWKRGFSALMVTDTSFYRNDNYHRPTDTMETLDLSRMAKVIDAVMIALSTL